MGIRLQFVERRKNPRFKVEETAYVINAGKSGLITDISLDGLSWRYVVQKNRALELSPTLDIVIDDQEFFLENIPYCVVSDCEAEHDCPDRSLVVRRCSVRFGDLTEPQRAGLEELIGQDQGIPQSVCSGMLLN